MKTTLDILIFLSTYLRLMSSYEDVDGLEKIQVDGLKKIQVI